MTTGRAALDFRYDPAEHRVKHCWNKPDAGFQEIGSGIVGKCPNTLTKQQAEELLRHGIPYVREGGLHPSRIYAVHDGVIYEAVPTVPGVSYHGYPWRKSPGRNAIPRLILETLELRATEQNQLRQFKDWMANHGR